MEKITKKNSIFFNQLWINKAIEDGNYHLLISNKPKEYSIGEIIELRYELEDLDPKSKKITEENSILYTREWINKFLEEGLRKYIPTRRITTRYSIGKILSLKYYELTVLNNSKNNQSAKVLKLKGEK